MAFAGQRSLQIRQSLPRLQARQVDSFNKARPIFTSRGATGWMAPVGHTLLHIMHSSQAPFLGISSGVPYDRTPSAKETALKPLVGHTFIQRLHRLHTVKKSFSTRAPGGRSLRASLPRDSDLRAVSPTIPPASSVAPNLNNLRRECEG